jgi:hypothetical protein
MADKSDGRESVGGKRTNSETSSLISVEDGISYAAPESSKIGVAGAFFLILNKMIGTGSMSNDKVDHFVVHLRMLTGAFQSFQPHPVSSRQLARLELAC